MACTERGITLLELLICLALIALLTGFTVPGLAPLVRDQQLAMVGEELLRSVNLARATAINRYSVVTLCPSADGQTCGGSWEQGRILFTDHTADRIINGQDRLVQAWGVLPASVTVRFRAFGNRLFLQMVPQGFTHYQNGNFTICPVDGEPQLARQLVISRSGRVRRARDLDGDGLRENSQGKALICP